MKNKKILITGATGFIGFNLVKALYKNNEVSVLTRYAAPIKHQRFGDIWNNVEVIEGDLRNCNSFHKLKENGYSTVFHLAAYNHVGQSWANYQECFDVNAKGTANLLEALKYCHKFVYISSSEVYGRQEIVPWKEIFTPRPESPYGVTKYAGELYCEMMQRRGMSISIVRPFNTYGPWQSTKAFIPEMINSFFRGDDVYTTGGQQTREFIYIDDTIKGIIKAAEADYQGPINLSSGRDHSINHVSNLIKALIGSNSRILRNKPYRPNEIWTMRGSNKRAQNELDWDPKVSLEQGLSKTIDWYREFLGEGKWEKVGQSYKITS
jgi:UDP-glucose 4-epimerase